jgi:RNA polymerase sigma factor (sigma-70 family)
MSQEPYLNEKTFNELFSLYYKPICYCVFNFVKRLQAAEDITKDAFTALWIRRETFAHAKPVKGFLYITACNAARNMIKHMKVMQRKEEAIIESFYISEAKEADEALNKMINSELMSLVYGAIETLRPEQKKVIKACYIDGLKNTEAVIVLNKNMHTFKELKSQGINNLKRVLNKNEVIKNYLL